MGSKINKICELSAEVGKAVLIMAEKDDQIAQMQEYINKAQESYQALENQSVGMMDQNKELREEIEYLKGQLEGKNKAIEVTEMKANNLRQDVVSLRKSLREEKKVSDKLSFEISAFNSREVGEKPAPKLVSKD